MSKVITEKKGQGRPRGSQSRANGKLLHWMDKAINQATEIDDEYDHMLLVLIKIANNKTGIMVTDKFGHLVDEYVPPDVRANAAGKALPYLMSPQAVQINHADSEGNPLRIQAIDKFNVLVLGSQADVEKYLPHNEEDDDNTIDGNVEVGVVTEAAA